MRIRGKFYARKRIRYARSTTSSETIPTANLGQELDITINRGTTHQDAQTSLTSKHSAPEQFAQGYDASKGQYVDMISRSREDISVQSEGRTLTRFDDEIPPNQPVLPHTQPVSASESKHVAPRQNDPALLDAIWRFKVMSEKKDIDQLFWGRLTAMLVFLRLYVESEDMGWIDASVLAASLAEDRGSCSGLDVFLSGLDMFCGGTGGTHSGLVGMAVGLSRKQQIWQ
ncbi:uncharacterized protein FOMMEDRAFT_150911 [Fomitiporia mediterranea MF3/22]|uniref:uncharacterized protein n=1 Tax=Fomitiporia mediterranea (strain MF3/22) TaxID=694068 RepID=UPI00044088C6|nr:uncharacterized protein FOMMEDRAFT_150911 [Fomitiporia mediterranea MF3/22]EJD08201.1 hypothetical protein FOMMEDRAFT_150911 [Fomitiporia mediterranea MF3/22]